VIGYLIPCMHFDWLEQVDKSDRCLVEFVIDEVDVKM
jgi:hypothetical protein